MFGQAFLIAGLGKFRNLDGTVKSFETLDIPFANVQAPMIAGLEFGGGILLLVGLGTRTASFLLACTMVVALATAHRKDLVPGLMLDVDYSTVAPLPFLVGVVWLLAKGAGKVSLDHWIARRKAGG